MDPLEKTAFDRAVRKYEKFHDQWTAEYKYVLWSTVYGLNWLLLSIKQTFETNTMRHGISK